MNTLPTDATPEETLVTLGLSQYAARTFVALIELGSGSAREVSEVSEVPRTRVYDAVEELQATGLVDVQEASPRRFYPVSAKTAERRFRRVFERRIAILIEHLEALEPDVETTETVGVWTLRGEDAVHDRCLEFIERANDQVVYMTVEGLLDETLVDALRDAQDRGVDVQVAGVSDSASDRILDAIPDVETFDTMWNWSDTPAGRVLMVDGEQTLVSVITNERAGPNPIRQEVAIWSSGESNSLVVILKAMFTWRMDGSSYRQ